MGPTRRSSFPFALAALLLWMLSAAPLPAADGFASVNGVTTGGAGGPTVTVTTAADFRTHATQSGPLIIQVSGTIDLGSTAVSIASDKSIVGLDSSAKLIGELAVNGQSNVIFQNLTISNDGVGGTGDGIRIINGAHHIWIDHCTFVDCSDGMLDITKASDYVTVSWCKFYYTRNNGHNFVNLIGGSDNDTGDRGKLHVTFHHNWWSTLAIERMPRVRFGQVHLYNNYFSSAGNNYCLRAALESQNLVENNYFDGVNDAWEYYTTSGQTPGLIKAAGNVFVNTAVPAGGNDNVFTPPYSYTLDPAADVKSIVMAGAGAGNGGGSTPPASPPAAPTALSATAVSSSRIDLAWSDNSSDESGFKVERSSDGVTFTEIGTTAANAASYSDTGLSAGTTYHYRVRAFNSAGDSSYSNTATATTQNASPPAAPSSLTASSGKRKVSLSWSDNSSNEDGFSIERSTDGVSFAQTATTGANATTYTDSGLTPGQTYWYRVRAFNAAGNSSYSNVASATAR